MVRLKTLLNREDSGWVQLGLYVNWSSYSHQRAKMIGWHIRNSVKFGGNCNQTGWIDESLAKEQVVDVVDVVDVVHMRILLI